MDLFLSVLDDSAVVFEVAGLAILMSSGAIALAKWFAVGLAQFWRGEATTEQDLRAAFGHRVVLALEFFISADIVRSIEQPSFTELGKLAVIVVIRTILHYSLR